jgi:hypothetical protein
MLLFEINTVKISIMNVLFDELFCELNSFSNKVFCTVYKIIVLNNQYLHSEQ